MELTVPWEGRIGEAHENMMFSVWDRLSQIPRPVHIRALKMLGVTGKERRSVIDETGRTTESASMWIWIRKRHTNPDSDNNE